MSIYSRLVHVGHNVCIFLVPPQAGHLFRFVTSFRPLPAICLCLFFMCDVFFLGTALRMPSHMSPSNDGIPEMAAGIEMASADMEGNWNCCDCCDDRIADRKEEPKAGEESRGNRAEKADAIRNCCMAAMVGSSLYESRIEGQVVKWFQVGRQQFNAPLFLSPRCGINNPEIWCDVVCERRISSDVVLTVAVIRDPQSGSVGVIQAASWK